jgi:hypothetical protein
MQPPSRDGDPRRWLAAGLALLLALGLGAVAGCSHYRLGHPGTPPARTVFLAPVEATALAPQTRPLVATQVAEALARDGRVRLAARADNAEAVLHIVLVDYGRRLTASLPQDTGLARKFALTLTADVTLIDPLTGNALVETLRIAATREAFTDSGQQLAEYQTMPLLAEALAREIVHRLLDTW